MVLAETVFPDRAGEGDEGDVGVIVVVIPGRIEDANPESRDSGFALSRARE